MIDFAELERPRTPNTFLVAPDGLCRRATVDETAPRFGAPAEAVRAAFRRVAERQMRVDSGERNDALMQDAYVQRSALFRFPDFIEARFIPLPEGGSTLAVYSRSKYGRSDLGVNRKRIRGWLAELAAELGGAK